MSYTITVRTVSGTPTVTVSGDVPDGTHQVNGHEDDHTVQLGVQRHGPDGRYIARASHEHAKEGS